ncbi:MAG: valine--tRNA ligase [Candidatus Levybacteria bacterium RIFCSPHIGHO2_01_FULL_36_15b]|nr:MAG: valine--tRNA ligase [Candidatus Levybacteria bacterium RIFCSPHIGHO2_01_FULL_36_15b]
MNEENTYKNWEKNGYFKPELNPDGKPFSIILPPPNANAPLHFGHAMYTVEDILIRFHRLLGDKTLWLPGSDHAGFETQFVFEKKLHEEGKSRFDYDRETLYKMIWSFVEENRPIMENQLRRLGFSLDFSRKKFTLDEDIVKIVYKTFKKLYDDGLVYRAERLVNYCTFDGTSFSDLEVIYEERKTPLYYIKYGPLTLATTRPETKFGDTAVAVNPSDSRYQKYIGKEIEIETVLGKAKLKVIADEMVDKEFGTGVVKITPAHDFEDFEVSTRHNLPMVQVIDYSGKMNKKAGKFEGMYAKQARAEIVSEMQKKGLIERIDEDYVHRVGVCYKCKNPIEPLPLEQWFIKMKPLAKSAIEAVKKGDIKIYPKNFEKLYFQFLENIKDWNISRQIVWGTRIPAWKNNKTGEWVVTEGEAPKGNFEQDSDTFDTWFSSGQWPFATLSTTKDLEFYPTSVMETGYDILRWWVARMIMLGIYMTGKPPFKDVLLHGLVNDPLGKKMSKSKGNVINPIELVEEYGADTVRFALIYGNATGNDQVLSYPKLEAAKKFINKIRNISRYVLEMKPNDTKENPQLNDDDKKVLENLDKLVAEVTKGIEKYDFNFALNNLYEFIWHYFADLYIESSKTRRGEAQPVLEQVLKTSIILLHPFMPFVTEEIYQKFPKRLDSIMIEKWPKSSVKKNIF